MWALNIYKPPFSHYSISTSSLTFSSLKIQTSPPFFSWQYYYYWGLSHLQSINNNMRRNCNLELRLNTSGANSGFPLRNHHDRRLVQESIGTPQRQQQQQPLTIFYDGVMSVSDVTEVQARTILFLANKEMEERLKSSPSPSPSPCASTSEPSSPSLQSPICSPSMKKSLQTFLQKRNHRIQARSHPYNH